MKNIQLIKNRFQAIILSISLIFILLSIGCTPPQDSKFNQEYKISMKSYFNETVKTALAKNIDTRINASYLDLETGTISKSTNQSMDLYYILSCGSMCSPAVVPMENAKMIGLALQKPSKQECIDHLNNVALGQSGLASHPGYYTCVQTTEGRMGWIRYENDFNWGKLSPGEIQFTYCLWDGIEAKK